ncbi:MAG: WD40/YVTN/BNR-like repeat-containing protein, partial [Mycobacteriales bacterium]
MAAASVAVLVAAALTAAAPGTGTSSAQGLGTLGRFLAAHPGLNQHGFPVAYVREKLAAGGGSLDGPATEAYSDEAYPQTAIAPAQTAAAAAAFARAQGRQAVGGGWRSLGPDNPLVSGAATYTGTPTTNAGRVTALAVDPRCDPQRCTLYVGAAGGGVWRSDDALASHPHWTALTAGLTSDAVGSITIDPVNPDIVYVGTGEPNGSGDSEAGVGLFVSTDRGDHFSLVPGSPAVSEGRAISTVVIDPRNDQHFYIGTAVARHGSSSVSGGRNTPPGVPPLGLYQTTDGGAHFSLAFSEPGSGAGPATGQDFFQGGITQAALDPTDPSTVYVATFGYGLLRSAPDLEGGDASYHTVFATVNPSDSFGDITRFALAQLNGHTRVYVTDASTDLQAQGVDAARLYRVDNADVPASQLSSGTYSGNTGWTDLSSPTPGTPGYDSYNFCEAQCFYDSVVATPPGQPDTVLLGGSMNYAELFTANQPSNGRTLLRSTNAGVSFSDLTDDAESPPVGIHPDQHAIAFDPADSNVFFEGNDGGVVRVSGTYVDASASCASRGVTGADLTDCQRWLSAIPSTITSLSPGLDTLQFQSISVDPSNDAHLIGGTQDNGTFIFGAGNNPPFESVGGDGGQSGFDPGNPQIALHSYHGPAHDVNFQGANPLGWDWISDRLLASGDASSFYTPFLVDPTQSGWVYDGLQHVFRSTDDGGSQAFLDQHCNEFTGTFDAPCGDFVPVGGATVNENPASPNYLQVSKNDPGDLTGTYYGSDRTGGYIVALARSVSDPGVMWAATKTGRVFVTTDINAPDPADV